MTLTRQITKKNTAEVFRRASIKRRLTGASAGYETDWFDITNKIKSWGRIRTETEVHRFNSFRLNGLTLRVRNDDGQFNTKDDGSSLWNAFLTPYKTKVFIETGYIDDDGVEVPGGAVRWGKFLWGGDLWGRSPVNSANFLGVLTDEIILNAKNEVLLPVKPMLSIFEDVPATRLSGITGSQTASEIIIKIRDLVDANSVSIFGDLISTGAWDIQSTTTIYPDLDTTESVDMPIWDLMTRLAESEAKAVWIAPDGTFHFRDRTSNQSSTAWKFSGVATHNPEYGHTIKSIDEYKEPTSKIFTRLRVKIDEADTETSYRIKEESWDVGDSSTSFIYGQRTYDFENTWLNTSTADTLLTKINNETSQAKKEIKLSSKFIPALRLFDRVEMDYVSKDIATTGSLWGNFLWDDSLWGAGGGGDVFEIRGNYTVIGFEHNLDRMESGFYLREIL